MIVDLLKRWKRIVAEGVGPTDRLIGIEQCHDELSALVRAGGVEPPETKTHFCSGCHVRWIGVPELSGAELCGDCWRKAQPVLHAGGVERTPEEVMLSESNDAMHLRGVHSSLVPGASVEAGAQHPAKNTARGAVETPASQHAGLAQDRASASIKPKDGQGGAAHPASTSSRVEPPAQEPRLSVQDIDQIVEGIEHFIICEVEELEDIWRPYINKLNDWRADIQLRSARPSHPPATPQERTPCPQYLDIWKVGNEWLKVTRWRGLSTLRILKR